MTRKGAVAFLTVLLAVGCAYESTSPEVPEVRAASFNAEGLPTVSFQVEGMMCAESCAKSVEQILASQAGVQDVEVDFDTKTATCAIDQSEFQSETAIAALADKDFEAQPLP